MYSQNKPTKQLRGIYQSSKKTKSNIGFGPQVNFVKPLEIRNDIKKIVHYDCSNPLDNSLDNCDIPDEDVVYIKENLLGQIRDKEETSHDDDLSMVNINVSKLLSSSGSNSKEVNSLSKNSNSNNNTVLTQHQTIKSARVKKGAISNNISIESNNNKYSKREITAKRKKIYEKLMKKSKDSKPKSLEDDYDENELKDIVNDCNCKYDTGSNVNITNIIVNVKNVGTKSFDMKNITGRGKDLMMRDMKSLHLITQKALSVSARMNPVDSFDDERRSFMNFRKSGNELYIDDNSTTNNQNEQSKLSQIINIININSNYSVDKEEKRKWKKQIPRKGK